MKHSEVASKAQLNLRFVAPTSVNVALAVHWPRVMAPVLLLLLVLSPGSANIATLLQRLLSWMLMVVALVLLFVPTPLNQGNLLVLEREAM